MYSSIYVRKSQLTSFDAFIARFSNGIVMLSLDFFFRNAYEVQALKDSLAEIKLNMSDKNLTKFENEVEVHMQHIQTGLSQMGNLRVFMMAPNNQPQHKIKVVPTVRVKMEKS